jgi:hypothetical protein
MELKFEGIPDEIYRFSKRVRENSMEIELPYW